MDTSRLEMFKQVTVDIRYPLVVFEKETGRILTKNPEAEEILGEETEVISLEPIRPPVAGNIWELLHRKKAMIWNHIRLITGEKEQIINGLIFEDEQEGCEICTLLFEIRTSLYGSLTLENIVDRAGMVAMHMEKVPDGYKVQYVSGKVENYGYTKEKLIGHVVTLEQLVCDEDSERVREAIHASTEAHDDDISIECRVLTDEKQLIPTRVSIYYIYNEEGVLTGFEFLMLDLREEIERSRENLYLSNVISKMKNVLMVKSYYQGKRILKYISPNAGILGMNVEAVKKGFKLAEDYIHPEDRNMVVDSVYKAVANGVGDFVYTIRMVRDDGRMIWVENEVTVNRISDGEAEVSFLMTDVTEQKRMEQEIAEDDAAGGPESEAERERASIEFDRNNQKMIAEFNDLAELMCEHENYYGVLIDTHGQSLTRPVGPADNLGQFYDLFERSVFKEQFASVQERMKEQLIPQSISFDMGQQEVYMVFAPLSVEKNLIGYWVLTSFEKDSASLLGNTVQRHWRAASHILNYFYFEQVVDSERRRRKLAERSLKREQQEEELVQDMLEILNRCGENSLEPLSNKLSSYLFITDIGVFLENKQTKSVEKYFVRNQMGEEPAYADKLSSSVSEYRVLKDLFREKGVLSLDRNTQDPYLRELIRQTNLENILVLPISSVSGRKGYITFANANKDRPFGEKDISLVSTIVHIFEAAIPSAPRTVKKEILNEDILETYEHIRDAVFVKENRTGEIVYANKAMDKLFDYSVVGMQVSELINDQTEQYRSMHGMRKRFIANKKVTKWQSYMKDLDQIMNIVEIQLGSQYGRDCSLYILKKNKK